jgi:hypothetical protein
MRERIRLLAAPALVAGLCSGGLAWLGLLTPAFTDYELEAEPALRALVAGDFAGFTDAAPAYGGSLLLRAPFALLPQLWGGGDLAIFRSMAVPCLLATAILGVALWARAHGLGRPRATCWIALLLCAANPLSLRALETGHAEELLVGVLCVGSILAAQAGRPIPTGLLLGIAVGAKPWALLAVAPVLIMLPAGHRRALLVCGGAAAALLAPILLAGGAAVGQAGDVARTTGHVFQPWQAWWFFGQHGELVTGFSGPKPGYRTPPDWIGIARPLTVLVPLALCLLLARRLRSRPWTDGLLLLALVLLLRCLLDPWNIAYYELPFLLALLTWELHARREPPALSLAATLLAWLTLVRLPLLLDPDLESAAFLAWSVPLALLLTLRLVDPERLSRARRRAPSPPPLARKPAL